MHARVVLFVCHELWGPGTQSGSEKQEAAEYSASKSTYFNNFKPPSSAQDKKEKIKKQLSEALVMDK